MLIPKQLNIDTDPGKLSTPDSEISIASVVVGPIDPKPIEIQTPELSERLVEHSPELIQAVISTQVTNLEESDKNTVSESLDTIAHVKILTTCYQLLNSEYKQELLSQTNLESGYTMSFTEQEVPYISNYLVLTLAAESIQQAEKRQEEIKQQGISDLWVFKQGKFKWRISLGLFSTLEKAEFAKEQYAQQITQSLAVVSSWQTHTVTQVTINAQQNEIISSFEQK
ncbi:hypothetical protein BMR07_09460, partial [Methylococcaceae bacterium CS1]